MGRQQRVSSLSLHYLNKIQGKWIEVGGQQAQVSGTLARQAIPPVSALHYQAVPVFHWFSLNTFWQDVLNSPAFNPTAGCRTVALCDGRGGLLVFLAPSTPVSPSTPAVPSSSGGTGGTGSSFGTITNLVTSFDTATLSPLVANIIRVSGSQHFIYFPKAAFSGTVRISLSLLDMASFASTVVSDHKVHAGDSKSLSYLLLAWWSRLKGPV